MRSALLLVVACGACAASPGPSYPLHPRLRSASGGPITLRGAVAHPGAIPYTPGLTLTSVLRLGGGPTSFANGAHVLRGRKVFGVPLHEIVDHAAPDPELAPGDIVTITSITD